VDLEMKAKALATCEIRGTPSSEELEGRHFTDAVLANPLKLCGAAGERRMSNQARPKNGAT
jgi:hypothetical protein